MSLIRPVDFLALSGRSLRLHKARSALTLLGVFLGAFLLVISLSVGKGISESVVETLSFGGRLKQIHIYPGESFDQSDVPPEEVVVEGEMSDERRERIKEYLTQKWRQENQQQARSLLGDALIDKIATWKEVESVVPDVQFGTTAIYDKIEVPSNAVARPGSDDALPGLLMSGKMFTGNDASEVLVHESLAYEWGFRSDSDLEQLIGDTVQLQFGNDLAEGIVGMLKYYREGEIEFTPEEEEQLQKTLDQLSEYVDHLPLPEVQKNVLKKTFAKREKSESNDRQESFTVEYKVAGIFRSPSQIELDSRRALWRLTHTQIVLPIGTGRKLSQQLPWARNAGYYEAMVIVHDEADVKPMIERLEAEKLESHSMLDFIERVQRHVAVITYVMATIAAVALLVAALGISNVMAMSVLERTQEIGIMKAVGARESQIQSIFLFEGSLVGLLGGGLGVLFGWLASYPGNAIARWVLAQRGFEEQLEGSLFLYPGWIVFGVPLFAGTITMLAAWIPSRRAARVDPIEALRRS